MSTQKITQHICCSLSNIYQNMIVTVTLFTLLTMPLCIRSNCESAMDRLSSTNQALKQTYEEKLGIGCNVIYQECIFVDQINMSGKELTLTRSGGTVQLQRNTFKGIPSYTITLQGNNCNLMQNKFLEIANLTLIFSCQKIYMDDNHFANVTILTRFKSDEIRYHNSTFIGCKLTLLELQITGYIALEDSLFLDVTITKLSSLDNPEISVSGTCFYNFTLQEGQIVPRTVIGNQTEKQTTPVHVTYDQSNINSDRYFKIIFELTTLMNSSIENTELITVKMGSSLNIFVWNCNFSNNYVLNSNLFNLERLVPHVHDTRFTNNIFINSNFFFAKADMVDYSLKQVTFSYNKLVSTSILSYYLQNSIDRYQLMANQVLLENLYIHNNIISEKDFQLTPDIDPMTDLQIKFQQLFYFNSRTYTYIKNLYFLDNEIQYIPLFCIIQTLKGAAELANAHFERNTFIVIDFRVIYAQSPYNWILHQIYWDESNKQLKDKIRQSFNNQFDVLYKLMMAWYLEKQAEIKRTNSQEHDQGMDLVLYQICKVHESQAAQDYPIKFVYVLEGYNLRFTNLRFGLAQESKFQFLEGIFQSTISQLNITNMRVERSNTQNDLSIIKIRGNFNSIHIENCIFQGLSFQSISPISVDARDINLSQVRYSIFLINLQFNNFRLYLGSNPISIISIEVSFPQKILLQAIVFTNITIGKDPYILTMDLCKKYDPSKFPTVNIVGKSPNALSHANPLINLYCPKALVAISKTSYINITTFESEQLIFVYSELLMMQKCIFMKIQPQNITNSYLSGLIGFSGQALSLKHSSFTELSFISNTLTSVVIVKAQITIISNLTIVHVIIKQGTGESLQSSCFSLTANTISLTKIIFNNLLQTKASVININGVTRLKISGLSVQNISRTTQDITGFLNLRWNTQIDDVRVLIVDVQFYNVHLTRIIQSEFDVFIDHHSIILLKLIFKFINVEERVLYFSCHFPRPSHQIFAQDIKLQKGISNQVLEINKLSNVNISQLIIFNWQNKLQTFLIVSVLKMYCTRLKITNIEIGRSLMSFQGSNIWIHNTQFSNILSISTTNSHPCSRNKSINAIQIQNSTAIISRVIFYQETTQLQNNNSRIMNSQQQVQTLFSTGIAAINSQISRLRLYFLVCFNLTFQDQNGTILSEDSILVANSLVIAFCKQICINSFGAGLFINNSQYWQSTYLTHFWSLSNVAEFGAQLIYLSPQPNNLSYGSGQPSFKDMIQNPNGLSIKFKQDNEIRKEIQFYFNSRFSSKRSYTYNNVQSGTKQNISFQLIYNLGYHKFHTFPMDIPFHPIQKVSLGNEQLTISEQHDTYDEINVYMAELYLVRNRSNWLEIQLSQKILGQNTNFDQYQFEILIKFRNCIEGEFREKESCIQCKSDEFNYVHDSPICVPCIGVKCKAGTITNVSAEYWRSQNKTNLILRCVNAPFNCKEGQGWGNDLCKEGLIGPLCESCDYFDERGNGSYYQTAPYHCQKCEQTSYVSVIIRSAMVFICVQLLLLVITKNGLIMMVQVWYIGFTDMLPMGVSGLLQVSGILIKILVKHLQVFTIFIELSEFSGSSLNELIEGLVDKMNFLDASQLSPQCIFSQYPQIKEQFPFARLSIIIAIQVSVLFILLIFSLITDLIKYKRIKVKWLVFVVLCEFLMSYPQLANENFAVISCKQIASRLYLQGYGDYGCFTSSHNQYLLLIMVPNVLIILCLTPLWIVYNLRKTRGMQSHHMIYSFIVEFGILTEDYSLSHYYYEFVKMFSNILLALIINIFVSDIKLRVLMVILLLLAYYSVTQHSKPYIRRSILTFDRISIIILITSFILTLVNFESTQNTSKQLLAMIGFLLNFLFLLYLVSCLVAQILHENRPRLLSFLSAIHLDESISHQRCLILIKNDQMHVLMKWKQLRRKMKQDQRIRFLHEIRNGNRVD